jgi:hypothetical protein
LASDRHDPRGMKDQYVGDLSDFEKYALLRALAAAADLPLAVCWMLTAPDDTGEGARIGYLTQPERYRMLDPYVFDHLAAIVASSERNVAAVERNHVLERAHFFTRPLEDHVGSRFVYFLEVWNSLEERSLVFFDPDIGLASAKMRKGRKRSSMYVFDDELFDCFRRGHSLVVFDHWKRVQRLPYLEHAFARLSRATGARRPFALWGRERVVFFVLPQDADASTLEHAAREFARRWQPLLTFTSACEFDQSDV